MSKPIRTLLLAAAFVATGCSSVPPSPLPIAEGAAFFASGTGTVDAIYPWAGCQVSFLVREPSWTPGPQEPARPDDGRFDCGGQAGESLHNVRGSVAGAPARIAPGHYTLAAAITSLDDIPSPGYSGAVFYDIVACSASVTVEPSTLRVVVDVAFASRTCTMNVTLVPR